MYIRIVAILLLSLIAAGCGPDNRAGDVVTAVVTPTIQEIRESVDSVVPPPSKPSCSVSDEGIALIVRFEIASELYYNSKLRSPIWPGGESGITWGIGYDGGYATSSRIRSDWNASPYVELLSGAAGITGTSAKAALPKFKEAQIALELARAVFSEVTVPTYCAIAAKTFSNGWDRLPQKAKDALVATVYNRGAGMNGSRRAEMRKLRDVCVPAGDLSCMADEFRSMRRLWRGTGVGKGLAARYEDTARYVITEMEQRSAP